MPYIFRPQREGRGGILLQRRRMKMKLFKKADEPKKDVKEDVKEPAKQPISDLDVDIVTGGASDDEPIEMPFVPF